MNIYQIISISRSKILTGDFGEKELDLINKFNNKTDNIDENKFNKLLSQAESIFILNKQNSKLHKNFLHFINFIKKNLVLSYKNSNIINDLLKFMIRTIGY